MPELPEVQTVVDTLRPRLVGVMLKQVRLRRRDVVHPLSFDLARAVTGRVVRDVYRRAKRIVFVLADGNSFYIHLGMTGRLTVEPSRCRAQKHTHLLCELGDGTTQLRFRDPRRFGGIWWTGTGQADDNRLGPEPLQLRSVELARRLRRTRRAIKNALLDQSVIAGLGNIYADEALFAAGIHPLRSASALTLEEVGSLNRAIKLTLRRALRHRGSTLRDYVDADGNAGGFQLLHRVYARGGEPCHSCRTRIVRVVLAARSTHFCPRCQPVTARR